jgi:hypothetical protein
MMRKALLPTAAVLCVLVAGHAPAAQTQPQSIVGAWTLNKDKSDTPPPDGANGGGRDGAGQPGGGGGGRRGGGGGGGGGRGGFGGGFGGGGRGGNGGGGGGRGNPEDMQRRMAAMRDILQAADRLTITRTESMVIVTTGDGRTTRMATDGSKVKDDSTGIERRTHWDGDRLVSEISGAGPGKITETYALDAESHQLVVSQQMDGASRPSQRGPDGQGSQSGQPRPTSPQQGPRRHVYDPLAQ